MLFLCRRQHWPVAMVTRVMQMRQPRMRCEDRPGGQVSEIQDAAPVQNATLSRDGGRIALQTGRRSSGNTPCFADRLGSRADGKARAPTRPGPTPRIRPPRRRLLLAVYVQLLLRPKREVSLIYVSGSCEL